MSIFDQTKGPGAFAEALALDPGCVRTLEGYAEWALSQVEEGQDFQGVVELTTRGIRLELDNVNLRRLRYATLPLLSSCFPELDRKALLDLEAEDYAAVPQSDPSDEQALQLNIGVDIVEVAF